MSKYPGTSRYGSRGTLGGTLGGTLRGTVGNSAGGGAEESMPISRIKLHAPSKRFIERQVSGLHVDPSLNLKMVRSITSTKGVVEIDTALNEIFTGRISIGGKKLELFGMPSTVIMDNINVVIASQIYSREHNNLHAEYTGITTYDEYYAKRTELGARDAKITWLGSPSFVFSYENRKKFKDIFGNTCISMIFDIASYSSTACIKDAHLEQLTGIEYCNKFQKLKELCNNKAKFRTHPTFAHPTKELMADKFITSFEGIRDALIEEQSATPFQRYNELLSYFFPWDVVGIEVGGMSREKTDDLYNKFMVYKNTFITDLTSFFAKSDEDLAAIINETNRKILNGELNDIDNSIFILVKFIMTCDCMVTEYNIIERIYKIKEAIFVILDLLKLPITIYEYGRLSTDDNYSLIPIDYTLNYAYRTTEFELFEQDEDETTKFIKIKPAESFQLKTEMHPSLRRTNGARISRNYKPPTFTAAEGGGARSLQYGGKKVSRRKYRKQRRKSRRQG